MKYLINTTTLKSALDLIILRNNVSVYYHKSTLLQISVKNKLLILNTETYNACSQIQLRGSVDSDESILVFVDSLLFQSIIGTISDNIITLDFVDSGINIHTNTTTLKIPKLLDSTIENVVLNTPVQQVNSDHILDISSDVWKFISQYQATMLGTNTNFPVYQNIWCNTDGTIIAGNFESQVFTKSTQIVGFPKTCLLSNNMLNILISMPDNSKLYYIDIGNDRLKYMIQAESDSYSYYAEFLPLYEEDDHVGSYRADALLPVMHSATSTIFDRKAISPLLHQIKVFGNSSVTFTFNSNHLHIESQNVQGTIDINTILSHEDTVLEFDIAMLLKIFNLFESDQLNLGFSIQSNTVVGLNIWDDNLTVTIGKK